ncbi:dihydrolipoyl dehydrogenase [Tianweitania sediminis]|uniref:Dihydrolipoyl dehydrogenase n=1 Tax=Tianweitania sediminis TaxID=1502156 RepID=A0A8J7UIA3_9HYPH|nr:dihydrolipoyl dehydrogenase [Tianweitania sediminis]MBP0437580.1 dihydrolipoyl dehydrogenase [Tianweitania sediminis]
MTDRKCKVLVIGGGPGGYVAAIRAGQAGMDTVLVEAATVGGTCLNVGCIPSKAMIHVAEQFEAAHRFTSPNALGISVSSPSFDLPTAMKWKDSVVGKLTGGVAGLLKKAKVTVINGAASFKDGKTVLVTKADGSTETITPEHTIIATGSESVELPFLPFGDDVISSTGALALETVPERLCVVGGGYIGLELGIAYSKLGSAVTIVEMADRILPLYDSELTAPVAKRLEELGITVLTGAKVTGAKDGKVAVTDASDSHMEIEADKVLVTVGRRPNTRGLGLDNLVLDMERGFIKIDDRCRTSMRGIYAIGDVTGEPMLAHRAMAQGELVVEVIAGKNDLWDKRVIPAICFTDPEIVSAGLQPDEAKTAGFDTVVSLFPFRANGRAMTMEREDGFVRIVARKDNHLVLGIQAVGAGISEMAAGFGLAIEMGARLEDIAGTIHSHPTRGEAFQEAALKSLGHALHL